METRIESQMQKWKDFNTTNRRYILGRSCIYESTPAGGNFYPRLTIRIFIHEILVEGAEREQKVGEISIFIERDRWNDLIGLNAVKADTQLRKAAHSAKDGNWNIDPLPKLLGKCCEIIPSEVDRYEINGSHISEKLSI